VKTKHLWLTAAILLAFALLIRFFSNNSLWVEDYYSNGIYPHISAFLKFFTGLFPFSVGDVLYGLLFLWLIWLLIELIKAIVHKEITIEIFTRGLAKTFIALLTVYIIFNLFWGINYNREGIAYQLGLTEQQYSQEELKDINFLLLQKVNESKAALLRTKEDDSDCHHLFIGSEEAYTNAAKDYTVINYSTPVVKSTLYGWLGNYLGFSGYYDPFTGEAQVNTTVPYFLQPYTTCHEIAHQLGYAKENEANFVGYLAAAASSDTLFHYSVYLDLFIYANHNLYELDSASARSFAKQLLPAVKMDIKEWRAFDRRHKNPVEPVISWLYGKYLESNEQPSGVLTYDEVTGFLIAYHKKFGKI
jgi:Protein of unknown function (DUF3810)